MAEDNDVLLGADISHFGRVSRMCFVMSSTELKVKLYHLTELVTDTEHSCFCLHPCVT